MNAAPAFETPAKQLPRSRKEDVRGNRSSPLTNILIIQTNSHYSLLRLKSLTKPNSCQGWAGP